MQYQVNQEESEQNGIDGTKKGANCYKLTHYKIDDTSTNIYNIYSWRFLGLKSSATCLYVYMCVCLCV